MKYRLCNMGVGLCLALVVGSAMFSTKYPQYTNSSITVAVVSLLWGFILLQKCIKLKQDEVEKGGDFEATFSIDAKTLAKIERLALQGGESRSEVLKRAVTVLSLAADAYQNDGRVVIIDKKGDIVEIDDSGARHG